MGANFTKKSHSSKKVTEKKFELCGQHCTINHGSGERGRDLTWSILKQNAVAGRENEPFRDLEGISTLDTKSKKLRVAPKNEFQHLSVNVPNKKKYCYSKRKKPLVAPCVQCETKDAHVDAASTLGV